MTAPGGAPSRSGSRAVFPADGAGSPLPPGGADRGRHVGRDGGELGAKTA